MKHTMFTNKILDIKRKEREELSQALLAHNGSYEFFEDTENDTSKEPRVLALIDYTIWTEFRVKRAYLNEKGYPFLSGTACISWKSFHDEKYVEDLDVDAVACGWMHNIIGFMENPK